MKNTLHFSSFLMAVSTLLATKSAFAQYTITEIAGCSTNTVEIGGLTHDAIVTESCFVESGNPEFPYAIVPFVINRTGAHELARVPGGLIVTAAGINRHQQVMANKVYPG